MHLRQAALHPTQVKINDCQATIDRLKPFAEAEEMAAIGGMTNHFQGSIKQLQQAEATLERLRKEYKAEIFASEVDRYEKALARRDEAAAQLAELNAKIDSFSETTKEYFRKANVRALWIDRPAGMGNFPVHGANQRDALGRLLDVSPLDAHTGLKIVPDEEWEAVKQVRELYKERSIIGQNLDGLQRDVQHFIAKNPALAYVKPRQSVLA